jgi:phosphocarrier protein
LPQTTLTIINPLGLHARAAGKFVNLAKAFQSEVTLSKAGSQPVDGKSIMSVMLLAAPVGSEIELRVEGGDAEEAFEALCALVQDGFGELD